MMHHESKMITFICGENACGPLMLACMSKCSDMPLACVMIDMGMNNSCTEFSVVCDPSRGMMVVMPMGGSMMPMPMSCSNPMAMGMRGNGNGGCMGAGGGSMGMGGNSMGMHMVPPMMRMMCPMMTGSGRNMMHDGTGNRMCMMMEGQDMMNMNKLVLLKLDPTFACMPDTCNADVLRNAMKTACPIWQCRLECIRGGCMTVMVSRNPMTGEICAVEHDSGRGMMGGGGERTCGMLTMMIPMRSKM